ncbi:MAG: hypothetical protein AAGI28_06730 [Pseudomonadota bacterium]
MRKATFLALAGATLASPAIAQGSADAPYTIDLLSPVLPPEEDRLTVEQCEEEADAARLAGEIVVCRTLGETTDGSWDNEAWTRDYAKRTQGPKAPVFPTVHILPMVGITVSAGFGGPTEGPLIIDIKALPEAPEGSDADRIARGLSPSDTAR